MKLHISLIEFDHSMFSAAHITIVSSSTFILLIALTITKYRLAILSVLRISTVLDFWVTCSPDLQCMHRQFIKLFTSHTYILFLHIRPSFPRCITTVGRFSMSCSVCLSYGIISHMGLTLLTCLCRELDDPSTCLTLPLKLLFKEIFSLFWS